MSADYDFTDQTKMWQLITIATGSAKKVLLPPHFVSIVHVGFMSDGVTQSLLTDYIVVMNQADTMVASNADGFKAPIGPGGNIQFKGDGIPDGVDGKREIQIQAVGNGAKVLLVRGDYL